MWFKNLQLFRLVEPFDYTPQALHACLLEHHARKCGKLERMTYGWTPPMGGEHEQLVVAANGCMLIAARKDEKVLPTQVVREQVAEKVAEIERLEQRKVGSRERRQLFDETLVALLPQAFSKSQTVYAYIDPQNGWLLVDAASRNKAEELTVLLRSSLGSLKLAPAEVKQSISFLLTQWLQHDESPVDFTIEDCCEMHDPNHVQSVIRCVNHELVNPEIKAHLLKGKTVTKMALTWNDRVNFIVSDDFAIKRIRFLDLVQQEAATYQDAEAAEEVFLGDFMLCVSELGSLLTRLVECFGGLAESHAGAEARDAVAV